LGSNCVNSCFFFMLRTAHCEKLSAFYFRTMRLTIMYYPYLLFSLA
jgi:hypothetical protein